MAEQLVQCSRDGHIATVSLARAAKLHALTPAMLDELEGCVRALDADTHIRAVILTAQGDRAFCVGADIHEWAALAPLDMWRSWVRRGHQVFDQLARLRQPVVAAINGHAFGGGLELALTADIRIASADAQFALPEASIGTCPGWSGTQRLVQLLGASRAKYLALGGQRLSAREAQSHALVHEVVPATALQAHALAVAQGLASKAPVSLQLTKQLLNAAAGEGGAMALEAMAGALAATTADGREGIASFKEKRTPSYIGD